MNGGVNHFGSPFNFPEEFTTVYRLHPLVPDMIDTDNAIFFPEINSAHWQADVTHTLAEDPRLQTQIYTRHS